MREKYVRAALAAASAGGLALAGLAGAARAPDFSLLTVGTGGDLSVCKVNFTNGYGISDFGGAIDAERRCGDHRGHVHR